MINYRDKSVAQTLAQAAQTGARQLAILIDPDKVSPPFLQQLHAHHAQLLFFGGSLLSSFDLDQKLIMVRQQVPNAQIVLFPGSAQQLSAKADAILFLSLVSGRNPELLIGQQVLAAPLVKQLGLEVLPTAYLLIDGGSVTTAIYMSGSTPIPPNKSEIAAVTALAATMMGMQYVYLDCGSGAQDHVPLEMIRAVRNAVSVPIIVGGGITTPEAARQVCAAGADVVVVGNILEQQPELLTDFLLAVKGFPATTPAR
jgi:phosphoglycerol geranylgeranyltransferase